MINNIGDRYKLLSCLPVIIVRKETNRIVELNSPRDSIMKILIVEGEPQQAERLITQLKDTGEKFILQGNLKSIDEAVAFFSSGQKADLLFLDTELPDGNSFEIFNRIIVDSPIIFTAASDQYALRAFKHFSIDYLLKPLRQEDLNNALAKWKRIGTSRNTQDQQLSHLKNWRLNEQQKPKERLLIKSGNRLQYKLTREAGWFFADGKEVYIYTRNGNKKFLVDYTLEQLESLLDKKMFFRISRKAIVNIEAIAEVRGLISNRMEVKLNQPCELELTISRDRCAAFKVWLDQ